MLEYSHQNAKPPITARTNRDTKRPRQGSNLVRRTRWTGVVFTGDCVPAATFDDALGLEAVGTSSDCGVASTDMIPGLPDSRAVRCVP